MSISQYHAIQESNLPSTEKMVMMSLVGCTKMKGVCNPTQAQLARVAGCSRQTVARALKSLKSKGLVDWVQEGYYECQYTLKMPVQPKVEG